MTCLVDGDNLVRDCSVVVPLFPRKGNNVNSPEKFFWKPCDLSIKVKGHLDFLISFPKIDFLK